MTIAGMTLYQIAMYFLIYSFLGWVTEVVFQAVSKGKIVNRGFLNGPVCPIYGLGVLGIFILIHYIGDPDTGDTSLWSLFLSGMVITTIIELIGGWILDKLFHTRWWDYSDKPFNLHGYICLEFSIIWGIAVVFVVREVHPFIEEHSETILPEDIGWILLAVLYALLLADLVVSVLIMNGLNRRFRELDEVREKMRVLSDGLSTRIGEGALETAQHVGEAKVQGYLARAELKENIEESRAETERKLRAQRAEYEAKKEEFYTSFDRRRHFGYGRLMRAFPQMESHEHRELLKELQEHLRNRPESK